MRAPDGWRILDEACWHLAPSDSHAFWAALCRTTYRRPVTSRQQLGLVGQGRLTEDSQGRLCQPTVVLAVLEALVHEGQLRRRQCTRMEETILHQVQANGRWRGDPEAAGPCAPCTLRISSPWPRPAQGSAGGTME